MKTIQSDIVVIGAGATGICAAIGAAKLNKKVLLIEKSGILGGISTNVLDTMNGFYLPGEDNLKVVEGIGQEIIDCLIQRKACFERSNTYGSGTVITYDVEVLRETYLNLLQKYDVDIMFHTSAFNVDYDEGCVRSIKVLSKNELLKVYPKMVIDCSGDGDIAYKCGFAYDGVHSNTPVQSLTTTFRVANINEEEAKSFTKQDMWSWMKEANKTKKYHLPREEGSFHKTTVSGCVATNMVRVICDDPTDAIQLSKAEIEGQKQVQEYYRFMKDYLPGYQNSCLLSSSIHIGVRETRRFIGEHILTEEEVLQGKKFEDGVVLCGSPIEDHNRTSGTKWVYLKENDAYTIPFKSLIPKGSKNILVAGKCFSSTHSAHAASRSIAQCMGMGQGAAIGACIAIDSNVHINEISTAKLKQQLQKQNVQLEVNK